MKWEYKMLDVFVKGNIKEMNKLGEAGWEMIAIYNGTMYFKRPIKD